MQHVLSAIALVGSFMVLRTLIVDLRTYRCGVVMPLLEERDPDHIHGKTISRIHGKTLPGIWSLHEVFKESIFLRRMTGDPAAQAVASSLRRRLVLITCMSLITFWLFAITAP